MALFGTKKNEKKAARTASVNTAASGVSSADLAHVLLSPRITEKATDARAQSVYVFDVSERATKRDIVAAVKKAYGVTPKSVAVVTIPRKSVRHMRTGKYGMTKGGKKAYVYLKSGDTITLA